MSIFINVPLTVFQSFDLLCVRLGRQPFCRKALGSVRAFRFLTPEPIGVSSGRRQAPALDLVVGLGCLEIFIGKLNKENAITSDGGYDNFDDTMEDAAKNLKFDDDDCPEKFFLSLVGK